MDSIIGLEFDCQGSELAHKLISCKVLMSSAWSSYSSTVHCRRDWYQSI